MSAATTLPTNPDTLWKILPRSATELERDILTVTSTDDLRGLFKLISKVKREMEPDSWLPVLLTEYGFSEVAKLHKDWRLLLNTAKDLRGKWGTPYAVETMARLLRYLDGEIWEEPEASIHFPEFQYALGQYEPDLSRLATFRKMVNVIKPVRGRFRRVFHGWDDRQHVWDDSDWGELWDSESGVDILPLGFYGPHRSDDQFLVSLGIDFGRIATYPTPEVTDDNDPVRGLPLSLVELEFSRLFSEEGWPRLDVDGWDGDILDVGGSTMPGHVATCPLIVLSSDTLHEVNFDGIMFASVPPVLLDEDGFDGDTDAGGFTSFSSESASSAFELYSGPDLHETDFSASTSDPADSVGMDEDFHDGGDAVTDGEITLETT